MASMVSRWFVLSPHKEKVLGSIHGLVVSLHALPMLAWVSSRSQKAHIIGGLMTKLNTFKN